MLERLGVLWGVGGIISPQFVARFFNRSCKGLSVLYLSLLLRSSGVGGLRVGII